MRRPQTWPLAESSQLLYTSTSQSCLLNSEYVTEFEKPLDVFATKTVQVARRVATSHCTDMELTISG